MARNCGLGCTRGARNAERAGAAAMVGRIAGRADITMEAIAAVREERSEEGGIWVAEIEGEVGRPLSKGTVR